MVYWLIQQRPAQTCTSCGLWILERRLKFSSTTSDGQSNGLMMYTIGDGFDLQYKVVKKSRVARRYL